MRILATIGLGFSALALSYAPAAAECPGNPRALGTSRTLAIDPAEYPRIGTMQYPQTLPLADKEVVLTFDDGPLPPYTNRILEVLAGECVKANYFVVGRMARGYPELLRRIRADGHVIGTHSQNHPLTFDKMPLAEVRNEIEQGIASTASVLGDRNAVAPFFRIPGLMRGRTVEQFTQSRGLSLWSADLSGDDWKHVTAAEVVNRVMKRLDEQGKGVVLLHDIQPATAIALPELLRRLKKGGYRVVQVVPARETPAAVARAAPTEKPAARPNSPEAAGRAADRTPDPHPLEPPRATASGRFIDPDTLERPTVVPPKPAPAAPGPAPLPATDASVAAHPEVVERGMPKPSPAAPLALPDPSAQPRRLAQPAMPQPRNPLPALPPAALSSTGPARQAVLISANSGTGGNETSVPFASALKSAQSIATFAKLTASPDAVDPKQEKPNAEPPKHDTTPQAAVTPVQPAPQQAESPAQAVSPPPPATAAASPQQPARELEPPPAAAAPAQPAPPAAPHTEGSAGRAAEAAAPSRDAAAKVETPDPKSAPPADSNPDTKADAEAKAAPEAAPKRAPAIAPKPEQKPAPAAKPERPEFIRIRLAPR